MIEWLALTVLLAAACTGFVRWLDWLAAWHLRRQSARRSQARLDRWTLR